MVFSFSWRSAAVSKPYKHDDKTNQSHGGLQMEHALYCIVLKYFTWSKYPDNKSWNPGTGDIFAACMCNYLSSFLPFSSFNHSSVIFFPTLQS